MTERYAPPTLEQLQQLAEPHRRAITIYASTSPESREKSKLTVKSAVDEAIRTLRQDGLSHGDEQELRRRWAEHEESFVWGNLSNSLVLLLADDVDELFVLPNEFTSRLQVGRYFDLSQLIRATTSAQYAYGLTLSQAGWNLWRATATHRVEEMELVGDHPTDIASATNRSTVRDRGYVGRLVGDEGRNVLLETYAQRVAEAVESELANGDPNAPLFVFAAAPLLDLYLSADRTGRRLVSIQGAPDELAAHTIDAAIRAGMTDLNTALINEKLDQLGDRIAHGTIARDLADIARGAALGAVSTLVYDFTSEVTGEIDSATGTLRYTDDGDRLLSKLALQVLATGGEVFPVRPDEVTSSTWIAPAVAGLRFTLA